MLMYYLDRSDLATQCIMAEEGLRWDFTVMAESLRKLLQSQGHEAVLGLEWLHDKTPCQTFFRMPSCTMMYGDHIINRMTPIRKVNVL